MKFSVGSFDDIKIFLPKYLSEDQQKKLFDELKSYPENMDKRFYSLALSAEKMLFQGDGFADVPMASYEDKSFRNVKGFLISNSCDSSLENKRIYSSYLSFAPLISLEKYKKALIEDGHDEMSVENHISTIKEQKVSTFFYLPSVDDLNECFVRFDNIFSIPSSKEVIEGIFSKRLFTLSNYGFYLLLFKLSVHFSRIQEKIERDEGVIK